MTKLTPAILRSIQPKRGRPTVSIPDGVVGGLSARYGARGRIEFSLAFRFDHDPGGTSAAKQYRQSLGFWNDDELGPPPAENWISLDQARILAMQIKQRAARGDYSVVAAAVERYWDTAPNEKPTLPADSVEVIIDRYAREHLKGLRTGPAIDRLLRQSCSGFLDRSIGTVTRSDIRVVLDGHMKRDHGYLANRVHATLSPFFKWALDRELVAVNPMAGMARPMRTEEERDRVLTDEEFAAIWSASERLTPARRDALRLLMLTGARYDEVASLPWSELDLAKGEWLLPKERAKTKSERLIFLTPLAIKTIQARPAVGNLVFDRGGNSDLGLGTTGFPGLIKALKIDDARLHDVRRTVATGLQKLGIMEHIIDRCCGWSAMKGAKRRYQRHEYLPERREAMELWGRHVAKLIETVPCAAD
jgi:integrase